MDTNAKGYIATAAIIDAEQDGKLTVHNHTRENTPQGAAADAGIENVFTAAVEVMETAEAFESASIVEVSLAQKNSSDHETKPEPKSPPPGPGQIPDPTQLPTPSPYK